MMSWVGPAVSDSQRISAIDKSIGRSLGCFLVNPAIVRAVQEFDKKILN